MLLRVEKKKCPATLRVETKGYRRGRGGGVVEAEESKQTEAECLLPAKHHLGRCTGTALRKYCQDTERRAGKSSPQITRFKSI